jgi:hypothetical protein
VKFAAKAATTSTRCPAPPSRRRASAPRRHPGVPLARHREVGGILDRTGGVDLFAESHAWRWYPGVARANCAHRERLKLRVADAHAMQLSRHSVRRVAGIGDPRVQPALSSGVCGPRRPAACAAPYRRRRPPRGKTYIATIRATMITAAMATIETVEAATITSFSLPIVLLLKPKSDSRRPTAQVRLRLATGTSG